ncbi:MAG TPA: NYN domain-containing protein [Thermoanaerobaculia bacterium]|nr:NYN domain-containing protein [Thermoanaerobaculia bacterium]
MPFLVDGNNLIGRIAGRPPGTDEERRRVQQTISARLRSGRSSVVLFFDGEPSAGKREGWLGGLTVRYSGNRSADDAIIEAVERAKARRDCHVVTDDRALAERARARGARALSTADFWGRMETAPGEAGKDARAVDVDEWESFFADDRNRLP